MVTALHGARLRKRQGDGDGIASNELWDDASWIITIVKVRCMLALVQAGAF